MENTCASKKRNISCGITNEFINKTKTEIRKNAKK